MCSSTKNRDDHVIMSASSRADQSKNGGFLCIKIHVHKCTIKTKNPRASLRAGKIIQFTNLKN